jgi:hypothetical protein
MNPKILKVPLVQERSCQFLQPFGSTGPGNLFQYFVSKIYKIKNCHQVAAWVPHMFSDSYLGKNHKIDNNSTTFEAREKISTKLESSKF